MRTSKKGSQVALFTDQEVRRDYLKSKQWVEQHMRIKVHLTGYAVAYEHHTGRKDNLHGVSPALPGPVDGRPQGSLYNWQKHAIADAVEWIRLNSKYKPRIFVATTPGFLDHAKEGKFISRLVHNLKNGYGMHDYVWVRELTQNGYPHFHFVADINHFNPVELSLYWSGLFNSTARNSIRVGSAPNKQGKRKYWIANQRMAWYLTKYLGKSIGDAERGMGRRGFRTFAISQNARKQSQPLVYHSYLTETIQGFRDRTFELPMDSIEGYLDQGNLLPPTSINPRHWSWRWTGHGQTYCGIPQKNLRKLQRNAVIA